MLVVVGICYCYCKNGLKLHLQCMTKKNQGMIYLRIFRFKMECEGSFPLILVVNTRRQGFQPINGLDCRSWTDKQMGFKHPPFFILAPCTHDFQLCFQILQIGTIFKTVCSFIFNILLKITIKTKIYVIDSQKLRIRIEMVAHSRFQNLFLLPNLFQVSSRFVLTLVRKHGCQKN